MNKHILHLEEWSRVIPFMDYMRDIQQITETNKTSVKIDGSPSILFGVHEGSFFIATKSIFGKERKRYQTQDELNAIPDKVLMKKLKIAYECLFSLRYEQVYQADILLFEPSLNNTTKPNVITYHLSDDIKDMPFLISVHTAYRDIISFEEVPVKPSYLYQKYNVDNTHTLSDKALEKLHDMLLILKKNVVPIYANNFELIENIDNELKSIETSKIYYERAINNFRSSFHDADDVNTRINSYFNTFHFEHALSLKQDRAIAEHRKKMAKTFDLTSKNHFLPYNTIMYNLISFRRGLYRIINSDVNENGNLKVLPEIISNEIWDTKIHEGFVYTVNDRKYKIVDRETFSYINKVNSPYKK